jgi:ferrous iron transport protein A
MKQRHHHSFPLAIAGQNEEVEIVACLPGQGAARKLADLGLPIGSRLKVLTRHPGGPMVVARDSVRIALGAGMAHRILVAPTQR